MYLAFLLAAWTFEHLLFFWPYLFLLGWEDVWGPADDHVLAGVLGGGVAVFVVAWIAQRWVGRNSRSALIGGVVMVLTLGALTCLSVLLATLWGFDVGV